MTGPQAHWAKLAFERYLPDQPQARHGRPLIPAVVDMGTETKTDRKASAVRALTDR